MGQFMKNRIAEFLPGQFRCRQDHCGMKTADKQGGRRQRMDQKFHRPPDPQFVDHLSQRLQKLRGGRSTPRPQITEKTLIADDLPEQQDDRDRQPQQACILRKPCEECSFLQKQMQCILLFLQIGSGSRRRPGLRCVRMLCLRSCFYGHALWQIRFVRRRPLFRVLLCPGERLTDQVDLAGPGNQKPCHRRQPDIVLPAFTQPFSKHTAKQKNTKDQNSPGNREGQDNLPYFIHAASPLSPSNPSELRSLPRSDGPCGSARTKAPARRPHRSSSRNARSA